MMKIYLSLKKNIKMENDFVNNKRQINQYNIVCDYNQTLKFIEIITSWLIILSKIKKI